jgi:hypothetical protein
MSNPNRTNDLQGNRLVANKRDWKKPVLDILELGNAEAGIAPHNPDAHFTHRSG